MAVTRMFSRRNKNPLGSLIFSDGIVLDIAHAGDELTLQFKDYRNSTVRIRFRNVRDVQTSGDLYHYEVMDAKFERLGDGWSMRLSDDDGDLLLELSYRQAEITIVRPKD